jgi:hypothetical protein
MEYLTHILTFLVGLGSGVGLMVVFSNKASSRSRIEKPSQFGNFPTEDMPGSDIYKSMKR